MNLDELIRTVNTELGVLVRREPPCTEVSHLPDGLRSFYSTSNGIVFPFMEIYPAQDIEAEFLPDWACFGRDGYFSYCLCRGSALDVWDHDSGLDPENAYSDVIQLLVAAYQFRVENTLEEGTVVVTAVPGEMRPLEIVSAVKAIDARSSAQLLAALRTLPMKIPCIRGDGLRVVRALQARGVSCTLRIETNPGISAPDGM